MKHLVGKRFLVERQSYPPSLIELKLLEISESGNFLKLEYITKSVEWMSVADYEAKYKFIEVLKDIPKDGELFVNVCGEKATVTTIHRGRIKTGKELL